MKKNMLVIAPVMPQQSEIELFARTLAFLESDYSMSFLDPLSIIDIKQGNTAYYLAWQHYLASVLHVYDAFIGFSFGGVILQQCFPLFENKHTPLILFSTPTRADDALNQKLGKVIDLCEKNKVEEGLDQLYKEVYYPNPSLCFDWINLNHADAATRLITGLKRVLNTDSSDILKSTTVNHLHLIGEHSNLVNAHNVIAPKTGRLITVPGAGMRVLQDNLLFCKEVMMDVLCCEHE